MVPLRISAVMSEPVCYYGDGMHIDGILAAACYFDLPRPERDALPAPSSPDVVDFELPLAKWSHNGKWGFCGSAVHADWKRHGIHQVRRRTPLSEMIRFTSDGSVNVAGGRYKPSDIPMPTLFASELVWYAFGDLVEVERLLTTHIHNIGKLSNMGLGRVLQWLVDEVADDYSVQRGYCLTRRMPAGVPWAGLPCWGGLRPPYWHPSRHAEAVEPLYEELRP